jgi:hypothetical protein
VRFSRDYKIDYRPCCTGFPIGRAPGRQGGAPARLPSPLRRGRSFLGRGPFRPEEGTGRLISQGIFALCGPFLSGILARGSREATGED